MSNRAGSHSFWTWDSSHDKPSDCYRLVDVVDESGVIHTERQLIPKETAKPVSVDKLAKMIKATGMSKEQLLALINED